uniref:Uncharacterized protein n=1 Tax=Rhizophora mucronata TaxID=61149 RepID=A0A2P2L9I8_RHIMU
MSGVKKVGQDLLGSEISASLSSSSSSPVVVPFPELTRLEFDGMDSWEEWDDYYDGTSKDTTRLYSAEYRASYNENLSQQFHSITIHLAFFL